MKKIRLICRNSKLSLLQADIVKQKILQYEASIQITIDGRTSLGDRQQHVALHTVEGSDFFTQDIYDALENGEADIAVHSLKDMSGEHFFGKNSFAIVNRNFTHDVAIFDKSILEKIKNGNSINIGTSSPRREIMAIQFLKKALPQLNEKIHITTSLIRGNVETRLQKIDGNIYDGTILAAAGLNRLLQSEHKVFIEDLLVDKKIMILPIIECVPAPCQGAIVAEANPANTFAIEILNNIREEVIENQVRLEKKIGMEYGIGCMQKFGVTTISTAHNNYTYAAGINSKNEPFEVWHNLPILNFAKEEIFSSKDFMKHFFSYDYLPISSAPTTNVIYIANYKGISKYNQHYLTEKTILASGTKTWYELAKLGCWVSACADGLGLHNFLPIANMPLLNIAKEDITILTNQNSVNRWQEKGFNTLYTYKLIPKMDEQIIGLLAKAKAIFWSSFAQYEFYKCFVQKNTVHICPSGETANLLLEQGITPIIFPTLKSFAACN